ncbi:MAG: helix-turn-helix domain-containing protein [Lachnospiraceae bacterium]|nr:helix-turn-helix domain-containing protein [Candidatus Colinaster equi]
MDSREVLIKLREETGMNRRQFADYFGIPYRTIQDWELGNRKMSDYLLRLMVYKANTENIIKSDK